MDFQTALGYVSLLYFIRPDLEISTLVSTAFSLHAIDALFCYLIASHKRRNRTLWALAGFLFGIWALGTLFLLGREAKGPRNPRNDRG